MVGYAFMGRAHSQAWRTAGHFFDLPLNPRMAVICGRDQGKVARAAQRLGWAAYETDWKRLVARDDVQLVDVCTPGSSHAEISVAALEAGKHVLCEKPLANTVAEARVMAEAAERAASQGVRAMVGFNFRRVPAVAFARELIAAGRLGAIRQARGVYLAAHAADPETPLAWRFRAEEAGSGALGDLGAHVVDLTQYLIGDHITGVAALTETFTRERRLPSGGPAATMGSAGGASGRGTVPPEPPSAGEGGPRGPATGEPATSGFRRIQVTRAEHPYAGAWWPDGHTIGYEHTFTHEIRDLLEAIAAGRDPVPSFADGLQVQQVLDAVLRSAAAGSVWTEVHP